MKKGLVIGLAMALVLGLTVGMANASGFDWLGDGTISDGTLTLSGIGSGFVQSHAWGLDDVDTHGYGFSGYWGSYHEFTADGDWDIEVNTRCGSYGALTTTVDAKSQSFADFTAIGRQDFDVVNGHMDSGREPYMRVGELGARAKGSDGARMICDLRGDMAYFIQAGTYYYPPPTDRTWSLSAEGEEYKVSLWAGVYDKDKSLAADFNIMDEPAEDAWSAVSGVAFYGNGSAGMFGFTKGYSTALHKTGTLKTPCSGTLYAHATGEGTYEQYGGGRSYLNYNGFELPGGGYLETRGPFYDGFDGNPSIEAYSE